MKILMLNLEIDCAGVSWNLTEAINRMTPHKAKHVVRRHTFATKNTDLMFSSLRDLIELLEWADVLHFNQWIWTYHPPKGNKTHTGALDFDSNSPLYGTAGVFASFVKEKPVVFHFHGGFHQLRPEYWIEECERVNATILKCDPLCPIPAKWMPNVLWFDKDSDPPDYMAPLKIAVMGDISDSRRNNAHIKLMLEHLGFEYRFFGSIPREELEVVRTDYQLVIDNLTQGFVGMWSWEAIAKGQVAFARLANTAKNAYSRIGPQAPIFHVENVDTLAAAIIMFNKDRARLSREGSYAKEWAKRYYSPQNIANSYIDLYKTLSI